LNDLASVESLLAQLVDESVGPNTEAIALGGSYARGTATQFSDLDIAHFVLNLPPMPQKRLFLRSGILVTVGQKSLAQERAALALPERAITLVPAYRELRILHDPHDVLARFIADVWSFQWEPLQPKANAYTSAMLMLSTETPFKIASALAAENAGAAAYATAQIVLALAHFVAVQRGVLVRTNSTFMRQVHEAMGVTSDWTRLHRIAGGMGTLTDESPTLEVRALAAMRLFAESAEMLQNILLPDHLQVVMDTAQFAHAYVARHPASERLVNWLSRIADEQP
jgi:predicted nucleotidyltransferase